jgi:hypothetical protein
MAKRTAALDARGRDRDWLRFGGMGLREGARAGGAASVEYLAGDGGHVSSQRTVDQGREDGPPKWPFANADPSIKSLYASHFMVDRNIISAIFEVHGDR